MYMMNLLRIRVLRLLIVFGAFLSLVVLLIYSLPSSDKDPRTAFNQGLFDVWPVKSSNIFYWKANSISAEYTENVNSKPVIQNRPNHLDKVNTNYQTYLSRNKIKRLTINRLKNDDTMAIVNATKKLPKQSTKNIHIFYTLPVEWSLETTAFYPLLGFYVPDNHTIRHHFKNIQLIGANILIITWSPHCQERVLFKIFDEAQNFGIRIALEIENYTNRTVLSIYRDVQYFYKEFWQHQSLYKVFVTSKSSYLPMIYVKNVESISANDWKKLFSKNGEFTLRGSRYDAVFIGHISARKDVSVIKTSQFNGFYSRIVSNGATYASTWKYWSELKKSAEKFKLLFIPTVGPGYDENSKQKKVASTRRHRTNGQYYGFAWRAAMSIRAEFINIASYNDWLSGTQIEEAIPKHGFKDYSPGTPTKYIDLTRYWINEYIQSWQTNMNRQTINSNICDRYFNNTIC